MDEVLNYSTGKTGDVIVAKPSNDYRWRRYALVIFLFGYGIYSAYDGFIHYPQVNKEFRDKNPLAVNMPYPAYDIPFNKAFGVGLPLLSVALLCWALYYSRGMYRFDGMTLSVPGHPDVPIKAMLKVDRTNWDRKGIAYIHYQATGSAKLAILRLDDFIYDRVPTDKIFERLEKAIEGNRQSPVGAPVTSP